MNAIFKRRSIRKFIKNKMVEREKVKQLLKAGFAAPSARNKQPFNFLVIDNRELLDKIPSIHPYANMIYEATLAIIVLGDLRLQENVDYIIQDCSAATENILIEIAYLNLGGVWLGLYPRKERINGIKKLFNIPQYLLPISLIAIGYPNEYKEPNNRYIEEKIFFNIFE